MIGVAFEHGPDRFWRTALFQEAANLIAQLVLFVRKIEIHVSLAPLAGRQA